MALRKSLAMVFLLALAGCGEKEMKDDKARQAIKEVITREFQYYEGAKQGLSEAQKQEQQRREQEKQLQ